MSVLTIVTGTVGISIKDDVMDFTLSTGTVGVNITGEGSLVDVWIVSGTVTNVAGNVSVLSFDPICNVQWNPLVSGTSGLYSSWTNKGEQVWFTSPPYPEQDVGVWYSYEFPLLDTALGETPQPITFYPNTSGTVHFIGYTFTVPVTGYYNITSQNMPYLFVDSLVPGCPLLFECILELDIVGRHIYKSGIYSQTDTIQLDNLNLPMIYLVTGSMNTVTYRVHVKIIDSDCYPDPLTPEYVYNFGVASPASAWHIFRVDGAF